MFYSTRFNASVVEYLGLFLTILLFLISSFSLNAETTATLFNSNNTISVMNDTDGDGVLDADDLDDDNDGILDVNEGHTCDINGDCTESDIDNDGVADHMDVDSDGDGCPDAIEGADIFLFSSLDINHRLIGGVDTNGVPLVAGGFGQDPGSAGDILTFSVECELCNEQSSVFSDTDGDGIGDLCDIDDDNDGIIDVVELGCLDAGEIVWDHNDLGGTSLAGVVSANITSAIASVEDIAFGQGFDMPTSVNEFILQGSDADFYSVAKTGHEYVEAGFTMAEDGYLSVIFHGLVDAVSGGSAAGEYKITAAISDDNFTTFDFLYQDRYISAPITTSYELSYNELRRPHLLEAGKSYKVRLFLFDEQNTYAVENTLAFDDLKLTISTTCNPDADRDGLVNQLDLDSDNDGIPDIVEARGVDIDGTGTVDGVIDSDGDRIPDYADANTATCIIGDATIPTDGICDDVQGGPDMDLDGIQDADDMDSNGDGLVKTYDIQEGGTTINTPDSDGDLVLDYYDLDADNDGIPDVVEAGGTDANGDGLADNFVDVDGDGFNDVVDGDIQNNGAENSANALILTGLDIDADGKPDTYPNKDFDGDGILNHLDLDADNDGIPDVVEAHGTDTDGDGRAENYVDADNDGFNDLVDGDPVNVLLIGSDIMGANSANALQLTDADADANGAPDSYPEGDKDADGHLDGLDLDADNDGIQDIIEAYGADVNGDGVVDNFDTATSSFLTNADDDHDGFSNFYDTDVDNNGITGDAGAMPLILTSIDANSNGAPDNGMLGANLDNDAFPNHLDLDSDNDGILDIVEAGMADLDLKGMVSDALTNDADKNGWSNSFDGHNGGAATIITSDTNNDGIPDSYDSFNTDNNAKPSFVDIDSDDDGIVDNTEAQATTSYLTLANLDADDDGIDDAYDNIVGLGGLGLAPVNTDQFDEPDYLDADSDNDGELDILEGHDTNGDGVVDINDSPVANIGVVTTTNDDDEDGLLDDFDNSVGTPDATNASLEPMFHNDIDDPGNDRDWREGNCQLCKVVYAIQDGTDNPTTLIKSDPTTGVNIANADPFGKVRLTKYCDINGWRYYYNAANPTEALFAIRGATTDLEKVAYVEIRVDETSTQREAGDAIAFTKIMNRDWFVETMSDPIQPMDIRFYYPGAEFGINGYQRTSNMAPTYGHNGAPKIKWWKTADWDQFDPTTINADALNLTTQTDYLELVPSTAVDQFTGTGATDGTASNVGNGKNYVQFDGLTSFSGGTGGFSVGGSALPVELAEFRGLVDDCQIHLTWTVAETNLNGFYGVEWSADGENFESIDLLPRTFSHTGTQSYLYSHETTFLRNYYRLKMVDHDGSYSYSNIVHFRTTCNKQYDMMVYPNPIGKERPKTTVEFYANGTEASFTIVNLVGKIVKEWTIDATRYEWNLLDLNVHGLSSGTYYIIHHENEQVIPFTIQE